jgi:hypothetical protein
MIAEDSNTDSLDASAMPDIEDPNPEPIKPKPPRVRVSFGMVAPPKPRRIHVEAEDDNGLFIDTWFHDLSVDVEGAQRSIQMAYDLIAKYIPPSERVMVPVGKDDEPEQMEPFPTGPMTGPIKLTERLIFDTTSFFCMQDPATPNDLIPWVEFVYMSKTAPKCFWACRQAALDFQKPTSAEGNTDAGAGLDASPQPPAES